MESAPRDRPRDLRTVWDSVRLGGENGSDRNDRDRKLGYKL